MIEPDPSAPAVATGGSRWRWALWLKVAVTLLLFGWIAQMTDFSALGSALRRLDLAVVGGALALVLAQQVVLAWRWHRIVNWLGGRWSLAQSLRWVFVGLFFNQALPTAVGGDAVRMWALHRHGLSKQVAIGSVAVERGSGLALLALMIGAAVALSPRSLGGPEVERALLGGVFFIVAILTTAMFADKWLTRWLPPRLAEAGDRFGVAMRSLFRTPRAVAELVAGGGIATSLGLWAAVVLGRGLGLQFEASVYVALVGGAILLTLLPISLGGWGVREAGMVALFGHLGAPPEPVVALSVLWGILPLVVALPGGAYFWLTHRRDIDGPAGAGPDPQ